MRFRRPSLLDPQTHRRDEFECGATALDEWLRRYAGQNRRRNTAAIWFVTDDLELGRDTNLDLYLLTGDIQRTIEADSLERPDSS